MALTKYNISDLVTALLEGNEVTSQKTPTARQIWIVADMAMHKLIHNQLIQNKFIDGRFFSPAQKLNVNFDSERNRKYTDLKATPIQGFDGSVVLISPLQNDSIQFIYTSNLSNFIFKGLEAESVLGQTRFVLENKRVYYYNIPNEYTQVLVKSVASISDLGGDETIPIPEELENDMLDIVLQKFGLQQQAANVKNIYVQQK